MTGGKVVLMLRSRTLLWLGIAIFPPLGLVLVWMRGDWSVLRRLAATLLVAVIALVELYQIYGLRIEYNGAMQGAHLRFEHRGRHYAQLEENRARQRAEMPPESVVTPIAAPEAVPAKTHEALVKALP